MEAHFEIFFADKNKYKVKIAEVCPLNAPHLKLPLKLYYFKGGIQLTVTSVDFKTNIERKLWFAAYVSINLNNL